MTSEMGWRSPLLRQFTPEIAAVAPLTIVGDPDNLLSEQGLHAVISASGFGVVAFSDSVAFRYLYESGYREAADTTPRPRALVIRTANDVASLPYDLLSRARHAGRVLFLSLAELFPHLSPSVMAALDSSHFDSLYSSPLANPAKPLGERATQDFILDRCFQLVPAEVRTPVELLRSLLGHFYRGRDLPPMLQQRFVEALEQTGRFRGWPLQLIVSDRRSFYQFLEERWPIFVRSATEGQLGAPRTIETGELRYTGPGLLPFNDPDIRVYVDNLFAEGYLTPTRVIPRSVVAHSWMAVGVGGETEEDAHLRLVKLSERLAATLPGFDAPYSDWLMFAPRWAEWLALRWRLPADPTGSGHAELEQFHDQVEAGFAGWMLKHYAALYSLSHWPRPVMVHQVARYLAHAWLPAGHGANSSKLALLVIDGLAQSQWVVLRDDLMAAGWGQWLREDSVFAWVPTLTSVSRQSIFAGELPMLFAASIETTQKEEGRWRRFWEDRSARPEEIGYILQGKKEGDGLFRGRVQAAVANSRCRVLGVVVTIIDQMVHGNVTGGRGLHAQVAHWSHEGHLRKLLDLLLAAGYTVYLTADHGNIEAMGIGKPDVGAVAEERGERAHVFVDELTRAKVQERHPATIVWPAPGLPPAYHPLIAAGRGAFIAQGKRTVSHGGISLEEVIVPFVRLERSP